MEDSVSRKAYTSQINSLIQSPDQPLQPSLLLYRALVQFPSMRIQTLALPHYGFHGKQLHPLDPQSSQCSQVLTVLKQLHVWIQVIVLCTKQATHMVLFM